MSKKRQFLLSKSVWVLGDSRDGMSLWMKKQLADLVQELCGVVPRFSEVLPDEKDGDSLAIVVGTSSDNQFVNEALKQRLVAIDNLVGDEYLIKQTSLDSKDVLIISGQNKRAVMYGVFEFFERLGCLFLISRDILPEKNPQLTVPFIDVVKHTENRRRGLFVAFVCPASAIWSISDFRDLFCQMAKMKLNYLLLYLYEDNGPFIDYSYRGERKIVGDISDPDSGYISWRILGAHFLVRDIPVGREKFNRKRFAPLEFQEVNSSPEALDTGREFVRTIIDLAKTLGIDTWISFLPTYVSMNMSKYTRRMPRPHLHWSALVSFNDPVVDEINRNKLQNIMKSYPNAEGIFLGIPEGYYEDPYPDSQEFIKKEWNNYREALDLLKKYWGKRQESTIRADIGFVEIIRRTIRMAKEINPVMKLGISSIGKTFLLSHLHKILPKEIAFMDLESRSLWTQDGAPLHLFKKMRNRECIINPRAVDDGSLAGLQFNLNLYWKDRFCSSAKENGTSGLAIQTTHVRGNEHNIKFLADGMWNDKLTPKEFYQRYAEKIFGSQAVESMVNAYLTLEENEEFLGGRGAGNMPFNACPLEIAVLKRFRTAEAPFFEAPFTKENVELFNNRAKKFRKALEYLSTAKNLLSRALELSKESGRNEVMYLINKTKAYAHHLNTLVLMDEGYSKYFDAFSGLNKDITIFKEKLRMAISSFSKAEEMATKSAKGFAECVEHTSDLGVLWMINRMVIGTRVLMQCTSNVMAFHDGQEYWKNVEWELLFPSVPFPIRTEIKQLSINKHLDYEPG